MSMQEDVGTVKETSDLHSCKKHSKVVFTQVVACMAQSDKKDDNRI